MDLVHTVTVKISRKLIPAKNLQQQNCDQPSPEIQNLTISRNEFRRVASQGYEETMKTIEAYKTVEKLENEKVRSTQKMDKMNNQYSKAKQASRNMDLEKKELSKENARLMEENRKLEEGQENLVMENESLKEGLCWVLGKEGSEVEVTWSYLPEGKEIEDFWLIEGKWIDVG